MPSRAISMMNTPMPTKGAGIPSEAAAPDSARIMTWSNMGHWPFHVGRGPLATLACPRWTGPSSHNRACSQTGTRARWRSSPAPARCSGTHVTLSDHDPFAGGHLHQPHRSAGVQLLGGDPDLRSKTELPAVGEAGGGIGHHHRRVHFREEALLALQ